MAPRPKRPSEVLGTLAHLLAKHEIDPADIGQIRSIKVGEYGDPADPMITTRVVFSPKWETGPQWPVVQQAKRTTTRKASGKPRSSRGWRTAVVLPDPQIGFRHRPDGSLEPFHDEAAMKVALEMVASLNPDLVVHVGDLVDLAPFGKYVQEPAFALTTQKALDRAHLFLSEAIEAAPNAEHRLLEGNHDRRLQDYVVKNAQAAFGLKRANVPEEWPVMSLPHLLHLEELGVEYVGGYPHGRTWINDNICVTHAPAKLNSGGSSAHRSIDDERVSVIFGHVHRIELIHKTRNVQEGYRTNLMASPGCLCRIDGVVPSYHASTDPEGASVTHYENWQQGIGVIRYKPGNGPFQVDLVPIYDGRAVLWGEPF